MRTLLFLLALALVARAQIHPSLPEPGTLDGLGVNIHFTEPQPGELVIQKAAASAFWGTPLMFHLNYEGFDTIIACGETTSGVSPPVTSNHSPW